MKRERSSALGNRWVGYLRARDVYLVNARQMIDRGELRKASELLWGACAQMLSALASLKGISLPSHRETKLYVRELSKELKDEEMMRLFSKLEKLHANFYHPFIAREEFPEYLEAAKKFLLKLEDIARRLKLGLGLKQPL